jgi:hypothetical protein
LVRRSWQNRLGLHDKRDKLLSRARFSPICEPIRTLIFARFCGPIAARKCLWAYELLNRGGPPEIRFSCGKVMKMKRVAAAIKPFMVNALIPAAVGYALIATCALGD